MSKAMTMRIRDYRATTLVAGLSAAFGVGLLEGASLLATSITGQGLDQFATVKIMLGVVSGVFFLIAIYVAAIVTANTVGTVIAGRLREIALYRLIGASSTKLRRGVAFEGLVCAAIGSVIGAVVVTILVYFGAQWAVSTKLIGDYDYQVIVPEIALPLVATILVGWLASWVGSKRVIAVTPIQAVSVQSDDVEPGVARSRVIAGVLLIVIGLALLVFGVAVGMVSAAGVLIGVLGGIVSFSGIIVASPVLMPALLGIAAKLSGKSPAARIASQNGVRYPARSSRSMIGVVIAVALVTMFAVAGSTFSSMMRQLPNYQDAQSQAMLDEGLGTTMTIFGSLFGFSAIIAAVGLVNNLSLSVLQRQRELGLLRTLGFTARQIRTMIMTEAAQMSLVAVIFGTVLGTVYGWAGAQSLIGSQTHQILPPTLPVLLIVGILLLAFVLALVASLLPARRATRVSPVVALAID